MANWYVMFYDEKSGKSYTTNTFKEEYAPKAHCDPKTPIHTKMSAESCERVAMKRKKDSAKVRKEQKKKWVQEGCGHGSKLDYTCVSDEVPIKQENSRTVENVEEDDLNTLKVTVETVATSPDSVKDTHFNMNQVI